jgi:hypothetical protein
MSEKTFIDSSGDLLVADRWHEIVPKTFPLRFTGKIKDNRAIFEGYENNGELQMYEYEREKLLGCANPTNIYQFLRSRKKQISEIEKALSLSQPKCTKKRFKFPKLSGRWRGMADMDIDPLFE